ncbi:MAG: hypothetical protein WC850_00370 [Candidatus Gracilibacteria bacterium]
MNNLKNSNYSGSLIEGWNIDGSYNRIQYSSNDIITKLTDLTILVTEGISLLNENSNKSRLDIRVKINEDNINILKNLKIIFGNLDISIKKYNGDNVFHLIIGKNKKNREVAEQEIESIKSFVKSKINSNLEYIDNKDGFENFALLKLEEIINMGYKFEKEKFSIDEVFELWNDSFGWTLSSIESLLNNINNNTNEQLYGLRNQSGELISLVLISDGESTEWATKKIFQGQGLIEPLLIYANANFINKTGRDKCNLYVHARYNRSISPSVKSGMTFSIDDDFQYILTNHVEIDGEYQSFVEGVLDDSIYTENIIKSYLINN